MVLTSVARTKDVSMQVKRDLVIYKHDVKRVDLVLNVYLKKDYKVVDEVSRMNVDCYMEGSPSINRYCTISAIYEGSTSIKYFTDRYIFDQKLDSNRFMSIRMGALDMQDSKNFLEFITHTYKDDMMFIPKTDCTLDSIYLRELRMAVVISHCKEADQGISIRQISDNGSENGKEISS